MQRTGSRNVRISPSSEHEAVRRGLELFEEEKVESDEERRKREREEEWSNILMQQLEEELEREMNGGPFAQMGDGLWDEPYSDYLIEEDEEMEEYWRRQPGYHDDTIITDELEEEFWRELRKGLEDARVRHREEELEQESRLDWRWRQTMTPHIAEEDPYREDGLD